MWLSGAAHTKSSSICQTTYEHQVFASASTLAVASLVHPEEILPSSPDAIAQATKSEQNPSVSYEYKYV